MVGYKLLILFISQEMSRSQKDNIFAQAALASDAWQLSTTVMDMYESGKVKGQKLSKKQLASHPEFKQQYLQPIQSLPSSFQV